MLESDIFKAIENGFMEYNPFADHNFEITINKLQRSSARTALVENKNFKRKFKGYGVLSKSAYEFIMSLCKQVIADVKAKDTPVGVRDVLGISGTQAYWCDYINGSLVMYVGVLTDHTTGTRIPLRQGLLVQWKNWKLVQCEFVSVSKNAKRRDIFESDGFITRDMLYYSLKRVSQVLADHFDSSMFGNGIRKLIVNEICDQREWNALSDLLKHHTGDFSGVDHMLRDAITKERDEQRRSLTKEDVKQLGSCVMQYVDHVIKSKNVRYIPEVEYINLSPKHRPNSVIVYGVCSSLYYGYKPKGANSHYYLKLDEVKHIQKFLSGEPINSFNELVELSIVEIKAVVDGIAAETVELVTD